MSSITPFRIAIPDAKIERLRQKLALTDFPEFHDDEEPWSLGPPVADIKRLATYWESGFDWRSIEAQLNTFPQYTAPISVEQYGMYDVHFIHQESKVENAIPLLFIHGWPGSFIEVTKILPQLIQGGEGFPAFHVVAPSLIDFGFSSASKKKGFNFDQHAEACHKLMLALGYNEYVIQGGDLGSLAARFISLKYGKNHVKAHHINSVVPSPPNESDHPELFAEMQSTPLTEFEQVGLARTAMFNDEGNGYFKQQSTKPETTGYFMTDSPVGLLAWIYEKLHDWVDDYKWTDDEILTWVSIYYFSKAGPATTNYVYHAMVHRDPPCFVASGAYSDVPLGTSRFAKDLIMLPKLWDRTMGPVVFEKLHQKGAHFAAWERPDAIVDDLRSMFGKEGGAFGVVGGKSGFSE